MNLNTKFMGLNLRTPLVVSASPLSEDLDNIKKMEDAGAAAIVMHSVFEEQLEMDRANLHHSMTEGTESFAEALSYFPELEFQTGPEAYLEQVRKAKATVKTPIIASLNGTHVGVWSDYAKKIEQAGADALELNVYYIPTDLNLTGVEVEQTYIDILTAVKKEVRIPVTVKIGSHFSSIGNMAKRLVDSGADGLTLFNRFYQPDLDLENLEIKPHIILSTPQALRLPLRWIAILHDQLKVSLAATSGIHEPQDVLKMLMVGADVTMLCSVLLKYGIGKIKQIEAGLTELLEKMEYDSVEQLKGSMSQKKCADPSAYERALYMKALKTYKPLV